MAGTAKTPHAAALILGAALALAGCNDNSADSAPTPSSTKASTSTTVTATTSKDPEAAIWNPCDIPDSAISALGLNTASKDTTVAGVDPTGWKVCGWLSAAKTYNFGVLSSEHTLEESRQRTDYVDYVSTTVGSRTALQFRPRGATHDQTCWLAVEVPHGIVDFKVMNRSGTVGASAGEPCAEVRRLTEALAQYLPER
ncbi:DUF3558 domain-containing protein [Nocardia pseudovaccinii]|uniref:DUF3558 domain-containing protein n=1 Tax=Nocardia pseudovaccinii TaxID=189540 RepID=UPI0009FC2D81|nr:DUF3558 domain-containing protein [Nocardia pseudovaccinii]